MKQLILYTLFCLIFGCTTKKKISKDSFVLNGTWTPIKQEINGTLLPKAVYEKQTLSLKDSSYTLIAESTDKGIVKYSNEKMDIYGKDGVNSGKHFKAIYKLENAELTICYNLAGDGYPSAFETKGRRSFFLAVFKKTE